MSDSQWKTTLILTTSQRESLDEIGTRIRRKTDHRPGASEMIRAAVDVMVRRLKHERFDELSELVGGKGAREASRIIERWLIDKLSS